MNVLLLLITIMCERSNEQKLKELIYAWRWIQQKLWQWACDKIILFQIIFYTLSVDLFIFNQSIDIHIKGSHYPYNNTVYNNWHNETWDFRKSSPTQINAQIKHERRKHLIDIYKKGCYWGLADHALSDNSGRCSLYLYCNCRDLNCY